MKNKLLLIILTLCVVACVCTVFFFKNKLNSSSVPEELHVFLESYATNPALTQIIQYSKLSPKTRKIIAWHRFPERGKLIDLKKYNTQEVHLQPKEGQWNEATKKVLQIVLEELKQHPNMKVHLHLNMWKMDTTIRPFLKAIPKEKITLLHLYEDGYGEIFKRELWLEKNQEHYSKETIQDGIEGKIKWKDQMSLYLHQLYPVKYYFFEWEKTQNNPLFEKARTFLKDLDIENVDFIQLRQTLTKKQKQLIYRLSGFDYSYYASLMKNKKTFVFIMGLFGDTTAKKERQLLKKIQTDEEFSGIHASEYIWLYKPHPSYSTSARAIKTMKTEFPGIIEIPAQVPMELFTLAELDPTLVAGYLSSAFYSLQKDQILLIIRRGGRDIYIPFLKEVRHLDDKKFLKWNDV